MTKLIETDEEVEKAGKVTWRGARVSRAFRRKEAVGRGADGARDGKRYAGGIGGQLAVRDSLRSKGSFAGMKNGSYSRARQLVNSRRGKLRNGVVRKSNAPTALEALDSAIEKAKPLLARQKNGTRAAIINGKRVTLSRPKKAWGGQRVLTIHTPKQDRSIPNQVLAASRGDRKEKRRALAALINRAHPSTIAPGGGPINSKRKRK